MESNQTIPITKDYKVLVGCMTYNHSKYIVDALNGFAMQKTNFPFACIVMDDASTDGEPDVIKDWLKKECDMERADFYDLDLAYVIITPHQTNANCTMVVYLLKRNLYNDGKLKYDLVKDWGYHSEYLALCEGDDYWTDPEKLQIQSDCLDTHPEVDMCAHSFIEKNVISESAACIILKGKEHIISPEDVIANGGGLLATCSLFYRKTIEQEGLIYLKSFWHDYTLMIQGSLRGGIYYLPFTLSTHLLFVPNSFNSKQFSGEYSYKAYGDKITAVLNILDYDKDFVFHKSICAAQLSYSVTYDNKPWENIKKFIQYKEGFWLLSNIRKILVISKCLCPKFSQKIMFLVKKRELPWLSANKLSN